MSQEGDWVLIGLDERLARKQSLPPRIPVPQGEFEGLADKGLNIESARAWIEDFLKNSEPGKSGAWRKKNSALVGSLEAFVDKMPYWKRAQDAFSTNEYDKAITALKRIISMDPDDHAARLNLASAQANTGDHPAALKGFLTVAPTFAGDADYHVSLGQVHLAMQERDKALDQMVLALEAKPDCQPALDVLVQLGILAPVYENPRDAASLTYVRRDSLLEYLEGLWDAEPHDPAFFLEQLAYHEREKRHDVALAAAERAIRAAGDAAPPERAEVGRVAALRSLGRDADALAAAEDFAARTPSSAGAQVERAQCLLAAGRKEEALAAVDRALELDPGDQLALVLRFWPANAATDIQALSSAIPALAAFVEAHPQSAGALRSLARAELAVGRIDDSLALFARAVTLAPADEELRAEYWAELGKQQRYDAILADAANVANLAKSDWKLRWNEAEAYVGLGKKVEARAAFSAINFDDSLHVDLRKRAKRAVNTIDEGGGPQAPGADADSS